VKFADTDNERQLRRVQHIAAASPATNSITPAAPIAFAPMPSQFTGAYVPLPYASQFSPVTASLYTLCTDIIIGTVIKYTNNILVALFVPLILVNVLQIFGTASQLIPIFHRSLDLSIV